jgi:hypothetical protein
MIGRRVEFQAYEGYQGYQTLKGVGVIVAINYTYGTVTVRMPFERSVYGRGNYLVGKSDLITLSSQYSFREPKGRHLHYESSGYQFDYPIKWNHVFKILPEEKPCKTKTKSPKTKPR